MRDRVFVAGASGMLGSAVCQALKQQGVVDILAPTQQQLDLRDMDAVGEFFRAERPTVVVLAAAKVGGIQANINSPADFLFENLAIQNSVIHQSHSSRVRKFCFLGSSCIYPCECSQPMKEEYLLAGPLEPTNEAYALAKIAGLKMVQYYRKQYGFPGISLMPCNLYGTNDHFDLKRSHVLSALVKRFVDAADLGQSAVTLWGSGAARREFMHVNDAARAVVYFLDHHDGPDHVNVGWGKDISIKELSDLVGRLSGFNGAVTWDTSRPDGMMRKCLDVRRMRDLGFMPTIGLEEGVKRTIAEYRQLKQASR